jgi:hypothetical protein
MFNKIFFKSWRNNWGLRPNFDWVALKWSQLERTQSYSVERGKLYIFAAARYPICLLNTTLFTCVMFSVPHDFKPDLLWILLADALKKQFIRFINPALLLILRRENHSAELKTMCYLCRYCRICKAVTVVVPNQVSPRFLKLFKPS